MSREIIIDQDTKVGYNFQEKIFYIENKGTRTNRTTKEEALEVLLIVAPDTTVSLQDLEDLKNTLEVITSLSYTYGDNGAFIKTLALNDYDYNPLVIDCPLHKLYIMNTDIVFDLTLNVNKDFIIDDLISYYQLTLGLDVPYTLMNAIYTLLLSYYAPAVYNKIENRKDNNSPLYYGKEVCLSNYSGKGSLTYTLEVNPKDETTLELLGNILKIDQDTRTINLTGVTPAFADFPESEDLNVYISGVSTTVGSDTYTDDGAYTYVSKTTSPVTLTVKENFPIQYEFPFPKAYKISPDTSIVSINNPTATVVVTSATGFNVGDTLTIYGCSATENNGDYEIVGINTTTNTITLQDVPPTSLSENCGNACVLSLIGNVMSISTSPNPIIVIAGTFQTSLALYDKIKIIGDYKSGSHEYYDFVVTSTTQNRNILVNLVMYPYTPSYPTLSYNAQASTVGINITYSTISNLPVGEFYVDNNAQCEAYIGLSNTPSYNPITFLPSVTLEVEETIGEIGGVPTILKGLYSEVYS